MVVPCGVPSGCRIREASAGAMGVLGSAGIGTRLRPMSDGRWPDIDDPGLITPADAGLLTDRYELSMAAAYHRHGMNEPAVFELFARRLPPNREWLVAAGLGPTL